MEDQYRKEQPVLNGRFKLITQDEEFKMSLWVRGFGINDANENVVLPLMGSFNLDDFEETGNTIKLRFKIYPNGAKQYEVEIDPVNQTFIYGGKTIALVDFAEAFKG